MLEAHFETTYITNDETKFTALVANLGNEYLDQVGDRVLDPPATGPTGRASRRTIQSSLNLSFGREL